MPHSQDALPVVLLHGIGGSARVWTPQTASLTAAGFEPVALDLLGYGGRPAATALDFERLAEDVEGAIEQRGLQRPAVIGHSMGGMVLQTMLRRRPDAYRAAVLACTSPAFGSADGDFQKKFVADRIGPLDTGKTMADMAPRLVERMMAPGFDLAGRALALDVMSTVPPETYRSAVRCLVTFDERSNLGKIAVPTLCLACENDPNASVSVVERMASKIPGSRYVCLPGLGHLPNLEAPRAFDTAILAFLREAISHPAK